MRVFVILACLVLSGCAAQFEHVDDAGAIWSCPARSGECTLVAPPARARGLILARS